MENKLTPKEKSFLESMINIDGKKLVLKADEVRAYQEKYGCDPCDACGSGSCSDCKACAESGNSSSSNPFNKQYK